MVVGVYQQSLSGDSFVRWAEMDGGIGCGSVGAVAGALQLIMLFMRGVEFFAARLQVLGKEGERFRLFEVG